MHNMQLLKTRLSCLEIKEIEKIKASKNLKLSTVAILLDIDRIYRTRVYRRGQVFLVHSAFFDALCFHGSTLMLLKIILTFLD